VPWCGALRFLWLTAGQSVPRYSCGLLLKIGEEVPERVVVDGAVVRFRRSVPWIFLEPESKVLLVSAPKTASKPAHSRAQVTVACDFRQVKHHERPLDEHDPIDPLEPRVRKHVRPRHSAGSHTDARARGPSALDEVALGGRGVRPADGRRPA
jgi:hypothetical protein